MVEADPDRLDQQHVEPDPDARPPIDRLERTRIELPDGRYLISYQLSYHRDRTVTDA